MSDRGAAGLTELTVTGLRRVNALVRDTHRAVQERNYRILRPLGPVVDIVRTYDQGVSAGVYAGVDTGLRLTGEAAGWLAYTAFGPAPVERPWAATAIGIANGFYGDHLGETAADAMSVRHAGARLSLTPDAVAEAWPDATNKAAVFLHGLVETEQIWSPRPRGEQPVAGVDFGARLREELGYTPVMVRYNSGLPVAANALTLVDLINDLVAAWPGPLDEIVLIGHSMGGMVLHCALGTHPDWAERVSATVSLGSPFLGAPMARAFERLGEGVTTIAEARWLHTMIDHVSAGIRDLRAGITWEDVPAHGRHLFVAAVAVPEHLAALGHLIGDGLVVPPSAHAGPAYAQVEQRTLWGMHHQQLFRDERAYAELRNWLAKVPA